MIKIEQLEAPEPPTKFDFLEYLDGNNGRSSFKKELSKSIFEEFFNGDWRQGQEISKIVITQRFYQISPSSTQAWFSNFDFTIKRP